jgi:hypothetical protein
MQINRMTSRRSAILTSFFVVLLFGAPSTGLRSESHPPSVGVHPTSAGFSAVPPDVRSESPSASFNGSDLCPAKHALSSSQDLDSEPSPFSFAARLASSEAIVSGANTSNFSPSPPSMAVPGNPAFIIGPIEPYRLMPELIIRLHGQGMTKRSDALKKTLNERLAVLAAARASWTKAAGPDNSVSLATEDSRASRRAEELLNAIGYRVNRRAPGGRPQATASTGRQEIAIRNTLALAGANTDGLVARLNEGQAVSFEIPSFAVPLPLGAQFWISVVFRGRGEPENVFASIVADQSASLLYYGLLSLHPATIEYFAKNPELVSSIYRTAPVQFANVARSIRVRDGRVDTPWADELGAAWLWERAVGVSSNDAARFVPALLAKDGGRLALLYDAVAHLDAPHARFVLGGRGDERRETAFSDLVQQVRAVPDAAPFRQWPLLKPLTDPFILFSRVAVDDEGELTGPSWTRFWNALVSGQDPPAIREADLGPAGKLDAASLVRLVLGVPVPSSAVPDEAAWSAEILEPRDRAQREELDRFLFAQRAFAGADASATLDMFYVLSGFSRYRMVLLTLERMGVTDPAIYAASVRRAELLSVAKDPEVTMLAITQFQSALGLLAAIQRAQPLPPSVRDDLVMSLVSIELGRDGLYRGQVAEWTGKKLLPLLGRRMLTLVDGSGGDGDESKQTGGGASRATRRYWDAT